MIGFGGGAIGADVYCDRSGIHCRSIVDCAKVLDALKDPINGYYDARDVFTTVPRSSVLSTPYVAHLSSSGARGVLKGTRLGVIRESMRIPEGSKTEQPIVTAAAQEIKTMLGEHLGATLVELFEPTWQPDPDLEQMKTDFRQALAKMVPVFMPDLLFRLDRDGRPVFEDFAAAIVPTEFMPGKVFGTGTMRPIDFCVAMAEGRIAPPSNLDLSTIQQQELANTFRFHISQYLVRRAEDWRAKGFSESLADWPTLNARSKFWGDDQRAAFKNWEEIADPRNALHGRQGVNERVMLRELLRRVDMMVILENRLDALVRLHTPWPPGLIGHPHQYDIPSNLAPEFADGTECGADRDAGTGGLCHNGLRSRLLAQRRRRPLRFNAIAHADNNSRAGSSVLAGVSCRARQGRCTVEDSVGLRDRFEAARAATDVRTTAAGTQSAKRIVRAAVEDNFGSKAVLAAGFANRRLTPESGT